MANLRRSSTHTQRDYVIYAGALVTHNVNHVRTTGRLVTVGNRHAGTTYTVPAGHMLGAADAKAQGYCLAQNSFVQLTNLTA